MNSKIFINLLSVVFFAFILFVAVPTMAQVPIKGTQLALNKINAEDADAALDDVSPKNVQQEVKKPKQDDSPQSLQQEVQELKREVQRMRDENEARKRLEVPEEEKSKSVEDILSAVGREYTMLKKGTIGLGYTFGYSYYSGDVIDLLSPTYFIERRSNHNFINIIDTEYAILNNLTISANIPFAYKYNKVGKTSSQEATDLGDMSLGLQWQPIKAGGKIPTTILSAGVTLPTGTSPYKIDPSKSLATGNGYYSFSGGVSLSKTLDPLVAFGNLNYSYGLPVSGLQISTSLNKVDPGSAIGFALGFGYALSYQASLNLSTQFTYSFGSKYYFRDAGTYETGSSVSSSFNVGTGWRVTPTRSIYLTLSIGLTINDPDFSFAFRVPFDF
jgi:hypothetical protein